jgi:RecA-family ATPase
MNNPYEGLSETFADACRIADEQWEREHKGNGAEKQSALPFANLDLDGIEVPEPEWSVPNRIPARQACLFTGHGAAGKSTIGLHLCVAHVLGREWLGSLPQLGPAIFLDAEDDFKVIWRRLECVRKHYDTTYRDMIAGGLHILPMAGKDVVLANADSKTNKIVTTPLYHHLLEQAVSLQAEQVLIASAANVFAGNENDRSQVQQFESLLVHIAQQTGGSVTLIGHPSRRGMDEDGGGFSGSTAWHNSFRSRIWIEGDKDTPDLRRVSFLKNQYGPEDDSLAVHWRDGMFLPQAKPTSYEQAAQHERGNRTTTELMKRLSAMGLSPNKSAPNYMPRIMARQPEGQGFTEKELEAAMDRLLKSGTIKIIEEGPPSKRRARLVIVEN